MEEVNGKVQLPNYIKLNEKVILWIPLNLERIKVKKVLKKNVENYFDSVKFVDWYDYDNSVLYEDFIKLDQITNNILFIINDLKSYLMYHSKIKDSKNYFIILCDFNTSVNDLKEVTSIPKIWFSIGEMDIKITLDIIKHKKHNYDKKFDEEKDPIIYYENYEAHRNISKEIDIKKYKRHYIQLHQKDLNTFVGLYKKGSQEPPYFLQHELINHHTKPIVYITDRNIHPENVPKNIDILHIMDCEHILENLELIQKCCQSKKNQYPFTLNIILYTETCSKLYEVINTKLNMLENSRHQSKQLFINDKYIFVN